MQKKFVFFDFDGVIVDSFRMAYCINEEIIPGLNLKDYRGMFESNVHPKVRNVNGYKIPEGKFFDEYIPRVCKECQLVPGIEKIISQFRQKYNLIIVSSTPTETIKKFLKLNGVLDIFVDVLGNDISHSKVEKFKMIFKKYSIDSENCIFITDTLGDINEANQANLPVIGVTWGFHDKKTLEKGNTLALLDGPEELLEKVDSCLKDN